ncbi:MAG TPA: HAD-IA family hydrolase, partial [Candidatus Saccharimonadales bacterium]|nr:HAD-IA family hydrolase [Candidatus Saccharimonadales bacterium]
MTAQTAARLSDVPLEGCRLLVLDFDGVVTRLEVDWRAIKKEAARICRDDLGLQTDFSPVASGREHVLREAGAGALARIDAFLAGSEMEGLGSARLSPEVADLLAAHPALPLAIFSANSRRVLDAAIERFGLGGRVTAIAGREDVSRLKPHPEGLLKVLATTGCDPSRAIYVGDRDVDALAGEAAGVPTWIVSPDEPGRLESIAAGHSYDEGFNGRLTRYRALAIRRLVPRGGELLEIGPAGGA